MIEGPAVSITIDLDLKCEECSKPGRAGNGLCLRCTTKALSGKAMRSATGRAVKQRLEEMLPRRRTR